MVDDNAASDAFPAAPEGGASFDLSVLPTEVAGEVAALLRATAALARVPAADRTVRQRPWSRRRWRR